MGTTPVVLRCVFKATAERALLDSTAGFQSVVLSLLLAWPVTAVGQSCKSICSFSLLFCFCTTTAAISSNSGANTISSSAHDRCNIYLALVTGSRNLHLSSYSHSSNKEGLRNGRNNQTESPLDSNTCTLHKLNTGDLRMHINQLLGISAPIIQSPPE